MTLYTAFNVSNYSLDLSTNNILSNQNYDPFQAEFWIVKDVDFNDNGVLKSNTDLNAFFQSADSLKNIVIKKNKPGTPGAGLNQNIDYSLNTVEDITSATTFKYLGIFDKKLEAPISGQVFSADSLSRASTEALTDMYMVNGNPDGANTGFLYQVHKHVSARSDSEIGARMLGTIASINDAFEGKTIPTGMGFGYVINRRLDGVPGSTYDDKTGTKIGVVFVQNSTGSPLVPDNQ
jgi:hypothetical protein